MKLACRAATLAVVLSAAPARAATMLPGAELGWPWALPFAALLLAIATGPLLSPRLWHAHYGKIAASVAALTVAALAVRVGPTPAIAATAHALLADYLSFIVLLFVLYTVAGGILVTGNVHGTPQTNTLILALGTLMASFVGTTGAAMILIRPLIRANDERANNVHVVVFFIFLVANIGGSLSPLGDPPLFVGFLRGIDFFWTTKHLVVPTAAVTAVLLAMFYVLDSWYARNERRYAPASDPTPPRPIRVQGLVNIVLLAGVIAVTLAAAAWKPGVFLDVLGTRLELQNLARDGALTGIAWLSLRLTREEHRSANGFTWEPIRDVAKLFAAIFVTIVPVLAMLQAREAGAFAGLLSIVADSAGKPAPAAFFWLTGGLSAFLDNAPTYLVFFEAAGGDPQALMGPLADVLAAISMGAVYMGAITYIGNAPNFMVYAIAVEHGVKMPSFFGYMLWAIGLLIPLFVILSLLTMQ